MKKFTEAITIVRELNEKELSELQKSYRNYFGAKMKKFGVKSPAELDDAQKKEFFNEITKDWEKGKGASDTGKKDVEEHGVKESVNEANVEEQIKKECITKLSQFFDVAPGNLSKFKFDGKDNIKELTKALNSTSDEGTEQYYRVAVNVAKKNLGIHESEEVNESPIFEADVKNAKDFEEYAMAILKKQHGDDYDEAKAKKVIDGLSSEAEKSGDWGAAVGKLQNA